MKEQEFRESPIKHENGKLYIGDEVIMNDYEKYFIQREVRKLIRDLKIQSVCTIGFGWKGYAEQIFAEKCKIVYIIEAHPELFKRAKEWAKNKFNVTLINDFVQNVYLDIHFDYVWDDRQELVHQEIFYPNCHFGKTTYQRFKLPKLIK